MLRAAGGSGDRRLNLVSQVARAAEVYQFTGLKRYKFS